MAFLIIVLARILYYINSEVGIKFFEMIISFIIGIFLLSPTRNISSMTLAELIPLLLSIILAILFIKSYRSKIKDYHKQTMDYIIKIQ
jgi:uncharacterized protein YacL